MNRAARGVGLMVVVGVVAAASAGAGCRRRGASPSAGAADPRDESFAGFVNNAATAIVASARGMPHDPRWDGFEPARDLRAMNPSNLTTLMALGPNPEIVATAIEVEGVQQAFGAGGAYLRSNVLVFPDGRVRWASVTVRTSSASVMPVDRNVLGTLAPALVAEFDRTLQAITGACNLPMLTAADVTAFPPSQQADALREIGSQPLACAVARTVPSTGLWQPRFDDVSVIVRGNNLWSMVRSEFGFDGGRLSLRAPRVRSAVAQ